MREASGHACTVRALESTAGPSNRTASVSSPPVPGFYEVVGRRRDVRAEFSGEPVEGDVLARILGAAHSAPSVGLSQPWDFVLVTDDGIRQAFWRHVHNG